MCHDRRSFSFTLIHYSIKKPRKRRLKFTSVALNTPNTILHFKNSDILGFLNSISLYSTQIFTLSKISFKGRRLSTAEDWEAFVWDGNPLGSSCRFTSQTNKEILRVDRESPEDHSGRKKHPEGIENVRDALQLINFITDTWHF